ncbi:hypothetical protein R6Q57_027235 [Mikania cordata]
MSREALVDNGYAVTTQEDRDKIVTNGFTGILISADVVARGFDQSQVNLVINYDLPVLYYNHTEPHDEAYFDRIAGLSAGKGALFNLLCGDEDNAIMEKIETRFNHNVTEENMKSKEKQMENISYGSEDNIYLNDIFYHDTAVAGVGSLIGIRAWKAHACDQKSTVDGRQQVLIG